MKIAVIQPSFLPWLGYFEQMALVDLFVYLDDVQYTKQDWRNRNRLKSPSGVATITVPVQKPKSSRTPINQVLIAESPPWRGKLLRQIQSWYAKAPYFDEVFPALAKILEDEQRLLVELNYVLTEFLAKWLGIEVPTRLASEVPDKAADKNQKLIDICRHFGADLLYDGQSARNFIDLELFASHGIRVVFQNYRHQPYPQLWGGEFVSHLSTLDLVMNCGAGSREVLLASPRPPELEAAP